jgi:two-component system, OmpR family, response regulator MprA
MAAGSAVVAIGVDTTRPRRKRDTVVEDFTIGSSVTQGGRILVVDDETLVRETVVSLLADEGYVVEQATDGADAIAKVSSQRPDAILLDLMMPGMNGRQFLDALRELGHGDVPVVVMTAVQGLAQGVFPIDTDVIEKPFELEDLLNKVALAVFRSHGGRDGILVEHAPDRAGLAPPPAGEEPARERGVVLLIDRDRAALQRLDAMLSARGYTVVSMTRVTAELPRLARALEPQAIIVDLDSSEDRGTADLIAALRALPELSEVPILVFARARPGSPRARDVRAVGDVTAVVQPVDEDLLRFVEDTRPTPVGGRARS